MSPVRLVAVALLILLSYRRLGLTPKRDPVVAPEAPRCELPQQREAQAREPEAATPEPEPVTTAQARLGFFSVPESKAFSHGSPIVQDIERRLPNVHQYWNECPVTWVHEGTHYINGTITRDSTAAQGLYLLGGTGVVLDCPRLTLGEIAASIPESDRRTIFKTYLVQQRQWWDQSPLYLLNEWVAYGNGTACRKSLNWTGKKRIDTVRFFLEMEVYVRHMVRLAARDPDYRGLTKLETFVDWYGTKIREEVGPDDIALAELEMRSMSK